VENAAAQPLVGDLDQFEHAVSDAGRVLYLADNAGEIALDKLLIGQTGSIFFLFKVKCPVIASYMGVEVGSHMIKRADSTASQAV
jgi:uncharacterized protein with ATP-grasp and redox domains